MARSMNEDLTGDTGQDGYSHQFGLFLVYNANFSPVKEIFVSSLFDTGINSI